MLVNGKRGGFRKNVKSGQMVIFEACKEHLGFGCMSLTPGLYGTSKDIDLAESERVLRAALDSGLTLLSTSDFYTSWEKESEISQNLKLIGRVIKDYSRASITLAMKWGPWVQPGHKGFTPMDLTPQACKKRVERALEILDVDYIDVLQIRLNLGPCSKGTPLEETARAMKALMDAGKVKAIGVSELSLAQAQTIHSIVPISLIEVEWNLFNRHAEKDLIPWARSIDAQIIAYGPLASGMLTGRFDLKSLSESDLRRSGYNSQFNEENIHANLALVKEVEKLAKAKGCTVGQLALAWVLAQGEDVIPTPGTKRLGYLLENLEALDITLTAAELEELNNVIPQEKVQGGRQLA